MNKSFKVTVSYPPLLNKKGTPCLGQNRQFQWFSNPTFIYPMVPAYAASLLQECGYQVMWDDGIAEQLTFENWFFRLKNFNPQLVIMETKTPVIKRHWQIINQIKKELSKTRIVLVGDHVTALPEESMEKSQVDYIATGGDYDFLVLNIVNHINRGDVFEPGIYYREDNHIKNTGHFLLNHNLDQLPFIDRNLTKWWLYAYKNGNYKYTPGTYIYSARDCWWGQCSFCSWTTLYPAKTCRRHSVKRILDEIGLLIEKYQVKEIMDDSGTFPIGGWLKEFCRGMIERGYHKKIRFDCNMRLKSANQEQYNLMGKAGFRLILYGLESANQNTLNRINKNLQISELEKTLKMAKKAGLEPHITLMVGYPWETKEDVQKTIAFVQKLSSKGYIDSLQATILVPYPGTPLFTQCQTNKWLLTKNWDDYNQRKTVIKSPLNQQEIKKLIQQLYQAVLTPKFIIRKILAIRSLADVSFLFKATLKFFSHLLDFS
jgi:radical SAM superfamily enzyme YgiQ (UPF0313 family)